MLKTLKRWWNKPGDELDAAFEAAVAAERKACAKVCSDLAKEYAAYRDHCPQRNAANECARIILERSNA